MEEERWGKTEIMGEAVEGKRERVLQWDTAFVLPSAEQERRERERGWGGGARGLRVGVWTSVRETDNEGRKENTIRQKKKKNKWNVFDTQILLEKKFLGKHKMQTNTAAFLESCLILLIKLTHRTREKLCNREHMNKSNLKPLNMNKPRAHRKTQNSNRKHAPDSEYCNGTAAQNRPRAALNHCLLNNIQITERAMKSWRTVLF